MERIVLRHLKGSKSSQVEEFPLAQFAELTLGRDPASNVRFEPEKDDLVGRSHARITRDPADPTRFMLSDLNSRNGTFLNKARVVGSMPITPGDVIQLGAGGPEIEFDLDPRPEGAVKATRLAFNAAPADAGKMSTSPGHAAAGAAASGAVGKATVERMIGQNKKEGRRNLMLVGAALVLVAVIGGTWLRNSGKDDTAAVADSLQASAQGARTAADSARLIALAATQEMANRNGMTPAQIAQKNTPAVVMIEMAWKLIHTGSGSQIYRRFIPNKYKAADGKEYVLVDNGRQWVPAYVQVDNQGTVEPALTTDANSGVPIGGVGSGSGFVVQSDGFIITNRHVAAPWRSGYQQLDPRADQGPLVDGEGNPVLDGNKMPVIVQAPHNWVPADSKQTGPRGLRAQFEGRMDELQVAFPNNSRRIAAQIASISDQHDVALIKISTPQVLPTVEMNDNYNTIALGDPVVVMGYPAVSAMKIERIGQKMYGLNDVQVREVPEPTLSVGNIGKIVRASDPNQTSFSGDAYQLTINSTGGGNSGGPMFDSQGKVVGIYSWGKTLDAQISFAVPIRYAVELMTISPKR